MQTDYFDCSTCKECLIVILFASRLFDKFYFGTIITIIMHAFVITYVAIFHILFVKHVYYGIGWKKIFVLLVVS